MEEEKEQLIKRYDELKKEIADLKATLNKINSEKESFFQEKQHLKQKLSELINTIKEDKRTRNEFTSHVKESKNKRQEFNEQIKKKIEELKNLKIERETLAKKLNIQSNPEQLLKEISMIERKIETEVMSFEKEKQLMKLINEKRKHLKESKGLVDISQKMRGVTRELDELRKESDKAHNEVQTAAESSQVKHEALLDEFKKLDDVGSKEKEAFEKYLELKKQY